MTSTSKALSSRNLLRAPKFTKNLDGLTVGYSFTKSKDDLLVKIETEGLETQVLTFEAFNKLGYAPLRLKERDIVKIHTRIFAHRESFGFKHVNKVLKILLPQGDYELANHINQGYILYRDFPEEQSRHPIMPDWVLKMADKMYINIEEPILAFSGYSRNNADGSLGVGWDLGYGNTGRMPIEFVEWNNLEGLTSIVKMMIDQELLEIFFVMSQPEVANQFYGEQSRKREFQEMLLAANQKVISRKMIEPPLREMAWELRTKHGLPLEYPFHNKGDLFYSMDGINSFHPDIHLIGLMQSLSSRTDYYSTGLYVMVIKDTRDKIAFEQGKEIWERIKSLISDLDFHLIDKTGLENKELPGIFLFHGLITLSEHFYDATYPNMFKGQEEHIFGSKQVPSPF